MMRSLYSAVSGLQNHQTRMDVIGNNVANVNTTGFKKGRVTFEDILSQTLTGAARPTDERGGLNPRQVGLGMTVASIDTIMSQGSAQTTGKNTDLAIMGEGMFTMKLGERTFYTRSGNFMIDRDGGLVNPNGLKVQGWSAQTAPNGERYVNTSSPLEDMKIPIGQKLEAKQTSYVKFRSNLNLDTPFLAANATPEEIRQNTHTTTIDVTDAYGTKRRLAVNFAKERLNPEGTQWQWRGTVQIEGIPDQNIKLNIGGAKVDTNNQFLLGFHTDGTVSTVTEAAGANPQTVAEGKLVPSLDVTLPNGTHQTINLELGTAGQVPDAVTQFSTGNSKSTTSAYQQDGYEMSYLESFKIDDSGTVTGSYSNGERRMIGQIALSNFVNPSGLTKEGESLYTESNNSGMAMVGAAGTQGRGKIFAGTLEMSNVDLSETFTDMIVTERGFQANSRVVTTSDDMLREILQLKR
jgi:flagellar hook protein FlgE